MTVAAFATSLSFDCGHFNVRSIHRDIILESLDAPLQVIWPYTRRDTDRDPSRSGSRHNLSRYIACRVSFSAGEEEPVAIECVGI